MRLNRSIASGLATVALIAALAGCAAAPRTAGTPITAAQASESFETAWSAVDRGDADPSHGGVDWKAVHDRFAPRAEACTTRESLRQVIAEMLRTLGRSHFGVIPHAESGRLVDGEEASNRDGTFGLDLRPIESEVIVTAVRPDSPADHAGVQRGWSVSGITGQPPLEASEDDAGTLARYARNAATRALDHGAPGSAQSWVFLDPIGAPHALSMTREPAAGRRTRLGVLPEFSVECSDRVLSPEQLESLGVPRDLRIGLIAFNVWMPILAQDLDAAVDRLRGCDGIIIDLRGNPGGVAAMAMGFAGHFHDAPDALGTMRTRDTTLEFRINPRRSTADGREVKPFAGPLAIVVDPLSASTSEIFAGGLRALDRARIFGRASAGAALPAQMRRLPSGDAVMFAFGDFTLPDGRSLEGVGVQPDEPSGTRVAEWREGRDPDLRAAAGWISRTLRDRDCHE